MVPRRDGSPSSGAECSPAQARLTKLADINRGYKSLGCLAIHWEGQPEFEKEAGNVARTYEELGGFAKTFAIPPDGDASRLVATILQFPTQDVQSSLLVIHYSGHGVQVEGGESVLAADQLGNVRMSLLSWISVQRSISDLVKSDVFVILDTCNFAFQGWTKPTNDHRRRLEVMTSSGKNSVAPGTGDDAFTEFFLEALTDGIDAEAFITGESLKKSLNCSYGKGGKMLKTSPNFERISPDEAGKIFLGRPARNSMDLKGCTTISFTIRSHDRTMNSISRWAEDHEQDIVEMLVNGHGNAAHLQCQARSQHLLASDGLDQEHQSLFEETATSSTLHAAAGGLESGDAAQVNAEQMPEASEVHCTKTIANTGLVARDGTEEQQYARRGLENAAFISDTASVFCPIVGAQVSRPNYRNPQTPAPPSNASDSDLLGKHLCPTGESGIKEHTKPSKPCRMAWKVSTHWSALAVKIRRCFR